jgi:uncharacterized protein YecA (UPF0149 family)
MPTDPMAERYEKREQKHKLEELSKKTRTKEEIEAEEKLIKETPKVPPIHSDVAPGRNDPCPCGSGKKYKKCCGADK